MTNPTNAPEGANASTLPAAQVQRGSSVIPSLQMTFTEADAKARELIQAHPAIEGEDAESEARRNELADEWHRINVTLFTTQPRTLADAVAVLNRLLCPDTGIPIGTNGMEEGTLTLVRGFLATLVGKGLHGVQAPGAAVDNPDTTPTTPDKAAPSQPPYPPKLLTPQSSLRGWMGTAASETGRSINGTRFPEAIPVMPTDPETIGPNAIAVVAFWEGYMGAGGLLMDWFDDGDDERLETRFAVRAEEFRAAVTTAGPPVSVVDALALASLQQELLNEAASSKPYTVFGARGTMLKAIAGQLALLVPSA